MYCGSLGRSGKPSYYNILSKWFALQHGLFLEQGQLCSSSCQQLKLDDVSVKTTLDG